MEYRALGPLAAVRDGHERALGGPRQRLVLAVLLTHANQTVSQDTLIEAVWAGQPPDAAKSSLHVYISTLRKELGSEQILRRGDGYRVEVSEASFDVLRFEEQVEQRRRLLPGDPGAASDALVDALALWYGTPYGDLGGAPALVPETVRLAELRLTAVELRIEADLATGNHAKVIGELDTLVRENPLRERLRAQQMLALYRSGRQAEALGLFQQTRLYLAGSTTSPSARMAPGSPLPAATRRRGSGMRSPGPISVPSTPATCCTLSTSVRTERASPPPVPMARQPCGILRLDGS